jgi:hypothetical protein
VLPGCLEDDVMINSYKRREWTKSDMIHLCLPLLYQLIPWPPAEGQTSISENAISEGGSPRREGGTC